MYDVTGGGARLRAYNSCNLAWWHTYKHAALKIWQTFGREIFAPLWHHLYPGHVFYMNPGSLANVLSHLLFLCLSRDQVQADLSKVLQTPDLSYDCEVMAKDLHFLLNMAIPVVIAPTNT